MTSVPVAQAERPAPAAHHILTRKARYVIAGLAIAAFATAIVAGIYLANAHWPYRYRVVKPLLEGVLGSQITIARYHRTYFPHPGFVAEGITLRRNSAPDLPPLGSVKQLAVEGTWADLLMLRERVQLVDIQGLHLVIPAPGSRANKEDFPPGSASDFAGPETLIEQLKIHDGLLDLMRPNGSRFSFPVRELDIRDFQKGRANTYAIVMENAKPWGHIRSSGTFGPLNAPNLGATPVSGTYSFSSVRLGDIGELHGTLNSWGTFRGALAAMEATGAAETSDFSVAQGQPAPLSGEIHCAVNGLTGELVIHQVAVRIGATVAQAAGGVVGSPKITNVDFDAKGRTQDLLLPFVHSSVPIAGPVWLRGHAWVGPPQEGISFLQRLRVDVVFAAPAEIATNATTEKKLSTFSARAQKHDETPNADAVSSLEGAAHIRDGVVSSPNLTFKVAGAQAKLAGTFNLHNEDVNLAGNVTMEAGISHAVTGFKSALLKPFDPLFKKGGAGAVVPVRVSGGPGQYKVTQNLLHKK